MLALHVSKSCLFGSDFCEMQFNLQVLNWRKKLVNIGGVLIVLQTQKVNWTSVLDLLVEMLLGRSGV